MDMAERQESMTKRERKAKSARRNEKNEREGIKPEGTHYNPNRCLSWLEKIHTMSNNYNRDHEELLLNSGGSVTKIIHNINVDATAEQIKDIALHNHSNLKTPLQRLHTFNYIQQKPDEALQTYNS